ncbi:MFS transporter [Planctomonas sp. JC2975]|uniref:MFS transporter n=1 Tax=Planctomonas sp. JC2975 TaxID=2729626 RepID=UPI001476382C|nr:MFS transporter [Planctomonas sp. JC2975]NNC11102.1 MFS transporter [Planctomonas sp. JC2975]
MTDTAARLSVMERSLWPTAAWFWALQFAVLNPLLALMLVALYDATPAQVGLTLGAYNTGGFIASLLIPSIADRTGDYLRPLVICGMCGVAMVIVLAAATSLPVALVALVLLGGPPGVGSTLLFAQLRHDGASPARVIRTRAIVSFAWVIGPVLATACTGVFGNASALWLLAGIGLVNVATAVLLLRSRRSRVGEPGSRVSPPPLLEQLRGWRRWGVVVAFLLLQVTNIATVTVTALFVTSQLHAPMLWAGVVLGAAALLEIPALLLIGRLHTHVSARTLILISCVAGVAYYSLATITRAPWQLVALQPLNAWFFATVAGVGLTVFQDVFPSPGLASGLFTNTRRAGAVLSGLLIAALVAFPNPYAAVYAAAAIVVLLVLAGYAVTFLPQRVRAAGADAQ